MTTGLYTLENIVMKSSAFVLKSLNYFVKPGASYFRLLKVIKEVRS